MKEKHIWIVYAFDIDSHKKKYIHEIQIMTATIVNVCVNDLSIF